MYSEFNIAFCDLLIGFAVKNVDNFEAFMMSKMADVQKPLVIFLDLALTKNMFKPPTFYR